MKIETPLIHDARVDFDEDRSTGGLIIKHSQEIPDDLRTANIDKRITMQERREGEMMHVAAIPVAFVEKWQREGYDVFKEPIKKTVQKLKAEALDDFLTTNKRV